MNRERLNECGDCGGRLVERDRFWECENCGAVFAIGRDDEGNPFTYHPLQKKDLDFGKIAQKATEINVNQVAVKEIKLKDTIDADVHRETNTLSHQENVRLIIMFLENEEWDAAQDQINQLLLEDFLDAEAGWYSMACNRHAQNDNSLVNSFSEFTDADAIKLDKVIQNASPDFAKRILDLLFKFGYSNDISTEKIIALALSYLYIDSLYSEKERRQMIEFAFDKMIDSGYCRSFEYLLTHTLHSDEVDKYIKYLERFAQNCPPAIAQKYYSMIIDVDPGNISAHHNLIKADIDADSPSEKCIADFESLILYTSDPNQEVEKYISILVNEQTSTTNKSDFMWSLLGYHSKAPEGLKKELLCYAHVLVNSKLWIESRRYFNLLLSLDARNPDAYYGLCLVQLQSRNKEELISNKENLIDCRELRKAIALYQSSGDNETANELMSMTQEQKRKKKAKKERIKKTVIVSSIIFVILGLFFGVKAFKNYRMYSANNIQIIVTDKEYTYPYDPDYACYFTLSVDVENHSSLEVRRIDGVMRFYNQDDELLYEAEVWLTGNLEHGETYTYELEVEEEATIKTTELHKTPLDELKITWVLTNVAYENYEEKEYKNNKEKIINKFN